MKYITRGEDPASKWSRRYVNCTYGVDLWLDRSPDEAGQIHSVFLEVSIYKYVHTRIYYISSIHLNRWVLEIISGRNQELTPGVVQRVYLPPTRILEPRPQFPGFGACVVSSIL